MMKRVLIRIFFLLFFFNHIIAQKNSVGWDYPVKRNSEQWANMSWQERETACQIPEFLLKELSTSELTKIALNYPLYANYLYFSDETKGVKHVIERFNGLKELSLRTDGAIELMKVYADTTFFFGEQRDKFFKLPFVELLLAQAVFIEQLNNNQLSSLGKITLENYGMKSKELSTYSIHNIKKSLFLGATIINKQIGVQRTNSQEQKVITDFIANYPNVAGELIESVSKIICTEL